MLPIRFPFHHVASNPFFIYLGTYGSYDIYIDNTGNMTGVWGREDSEYTTGPCYLFGNIRHQVSKGTLVITEFCAACVAALLNNPEHIETAKAYALRF
jgi:hypothetical protein